MKAQSTKPTIITTPYNIPGCNWFCNKEYCLKIAENLQRMHCNVDINQKSNILQLVTYSNLRRFLRNMGFVFSKTQFRTAMRKQKGESFNLNNYRRHVPKSRMPLSETTLQIIKSYLDKNSRQSYTGEKNILEITKTAIFRKLKREFPSIKLSYSSFMKHCPKEYKLCSRRRTSAKSAKGGGTCIKLIIEN